MSFSDFRSVIDLWPTRELCADEIGATASQVSKWWQRDSIPNRWWESVLATDRARSHGVTADVLARIAAAEMRA